MGSKESPHKCDVYPPYKRNYASLQNSLVAKILLLKREQTEILQAFIFFVNS